MTLAVSLIGAAVTVALFLFVNPVAGIVSALVFGIVAIRLANAERRGDTGAGPAGWGK